MFPAGLRKQLQGVIEQGFVIKRSIHSKCLELYPMPEWRKQEKMLSKLNRYKKRNNDFVRVFMSGVKLVELDAHGRIQVAKDLVNYADLVKDIVVTSSSGIVEIWDKAKYDTAITELDFDMGSVAEELLGEIEIED